MQRLIRCNKEISALKMKITALNEILQKYKSVDILKLIQDTEQRLTEIEKSREIIIAEQKFKIAKLKTPMKEIFQTRYVDGLSFKAIAERLHYSESNIYKLHRALLKGWGA